MESVAGVIALVTSFIGLIPQIIKSFRTKSTKDLSVTMIVNYMVCSLAWIVYGWMTLSFFVVASNVVGLITCLVLIAQKYRYDAVGSS